ncbi:MAG: hypothetical protein QM811_26385 [Pirellulales bacterium]
MQTHEISTHKTAYRRTGIGWAVVGCLIAWALLLIPVYRGLSPTADDLGAYHLPLRAVYQQALQNGQTWQWNPALLGGYDVHGEGQLGGDHPWHQLLYRTLPLHWAFGLEWWTPYPLLFFGAWWWFRVLRFRHVEAFLGAATLALSGFFALRHVHLNATQVLAHLPWLLGIEALQRRALRENGSWRATVPTGCLIALLTGSQLLLGYPQYVVYSLMVEAIVWGVARNETRNPINPRSPWRTACLSFFMFAGWKLLGFALAASQLWPTWHYLQDSVRQTWHGEAMDDGLWHPWNLSQFIAPYLFETRVVGQNTHELSVYCGMIPFCLAALGVVRPRATRRIERLRITAIVLFACGFLLASGLFGAAALQSVTPVMNKFRLPARATTLMEWGIALAAVLGAQRVFALARARRQPTRRETLTLGILVTCSFALPLLTLTSDASWIASGILPWISPALLLFAVAFVVLSIRSPRLGIPLVCAMLVADAAGYAGSSASWRRWELVPEPDWLGETWHRSSTKPFGGWGERALAHDPLEDGPTHGNVDILCGRNGEPPAALIDGYVGVAPRRTLIYSEAHPEALQVAGITRLDDGETTTAAPLARGNLYEDAVVIDDWNAGLDDIDVQRVVALRDAPLIARTTPVSLRPDSERRRELCALMDVPGRLAFDLRTDRDVWLATTESYARGWTARVDGRVVPVLRVNGDFLGCAVPANARHVDFRFDDPAHRQGRFAALCALGLTGGLWFAVRPRRSPPARHAPRLASSAVPEDSESAADVSSPPSCVST